MAKITVAGGVSDLLATPGQPGYQPPADADDAGAAAVPPAAASPAPEPEPEPAPDLYDPGAYTVEEVRAYLATADLAEAERVLEAEAAGKGRKGILDDAQAVLDAKLEAEVG